MGTVNLKRADSIEEPKQTCSAIRRSTGSATSQRVVSDFKLGPEKGIVPFPNTPKQSLVSYARTRARKSQLKKQALFQVVNDS
jgi:hypothetical protein